MILLFFLFLQRQRCHGLCVVRDARHGEMQLGVKNAAAVRYALGPC